MAQMAGKRTTLAFTAEDLAVIEAVRQHLGSSSMTDAIRVALRAYLRSEGVAVPQVSRASTS